MKKQHEYHYLYFTRKEKNGIVVMLFLILLISFSPALYKAVIPPQKYKYKDFEKEISMLKVAAADTNVNEYTKKYASYEKDNKQEAGFNKPGTFFRFDPNTLSAAGWKQLGVKEKTIATIQKYISKGGKFRQPSDIQKIWGISPALANALIPFVQIASRPKKTTSFTTPGKQQYFQTKKTILSINEADSAGFEGLPGIGPVLAKRIVTFREKLGGFIGVEQVAETFGLPDSTFQKIKPLLQSGVQQIKKINLNTATLEDLKTHPYIRYKLANALIQYRLQHGNYKSVDEIKKIMLVDDILFSKISPYLVTD